MKQVIVIGGGAAGMMAAVCAAAGGMRVLLLEKNEKLGKKLYITGKGRCNLTNACDAEALFGNVLRNPKFLYSSFYAFSNWQTIDFFEKHGLKTKIERGERVFPVSDHSSDVIATLKKMLEQHRVEVRLNTKVTGILTKPGGQKESEKPVISGVRLADGTAVSADAVLIATGGISYPATGSTGDGYAFAKSAGHKLMPPKPALVPFETREEWCRQLMGLALKNVSITICKEKKKVFEGFGEMLFTHFGVSGPLLISASSIIHDAAGQMPLAMKIDLKPALSEQQLDRRILRDFEENANKAFKNVVQKLFPSKLVSVMISLSGIAEEKKVNEITKEERSALVHLTKGLPVTLIGLRDFNEAIITRGGVSVKEVNPSTMESRLVQGLYFAGEVLDVDALTGGFNLQIAWSTGYLAGITMAGGKEHGF